MLDETLRDLYDRKARAVTRRPSFARARARARVRLAAEAMACEVEQAGRVTAVDQPPEDGGAGRDLHPGELMRASLGACLAIGYRLWGARLGVPIGAVELEIVCELDSRGQLGLADGVAVGWQRIAVDVRIFSDAPEADVRRVVETADRLSPMLANLSPAVTRTHRLQILRAR
jgi:uncharacterized OsmC-like protein